MKILLILVGGLIALLPTWVYLLIQHIANPQGFWQHLVMVGLGLWVLGGIQFVLLLLWIGGSFILVIED